MLFLLFQVWPCLTKSIGNSELESDTIITNKYCWRNAQKDGLIITLTDNANYGNIIQRYALKRVLEQNARSFDTTYIQQRPHKQTSVNDKTSLNFKNTRAFVKKYMTSEDFDPIKLQGYRNYIVGSDQIWRDWHLGWKNFSRFFLEFIDTSLCLNSNTNRISYAASFGVSNVEVAMNVSTQILIRPLLEKFSAISVREESGQRILKNTWGLESVLVLDPTLLLNSSDYSELIENSTSANTEIKKLFYYILDKKKSKIDFILKISRALGCGKTGIIPSLWKSFEPVEKWLKGFRDAKFVVTDSYHGMIFSLINNTDFLVIGNLRRGRTRFESLLRVLGLSSRLVSEEALAHIELSDFSYIDWNAVNKKLEPLRKNSIHWLLENLQ